MERNKRVKMLDDQPETLDLYAMNIPIETVPEDEKLQSELRKIAKCFSSKISEEQKLLMWSEEFPEEYEDNEPQLRERPKKEPIAPLPMPMGVDFWKWLITANHDTLLGRPSLFAVEFKTSAAYRNLCYGLEVFINKKIPNQEFLRFIESHSFMSTPARHKCFYGTALEYTSQTKQLIVLVKDDKMEHFWILPNEKQ